MSAPDFRIKVLGALARLQPGDVFSYGDLAAAAGYPGAARGAGAVLAGSGGDNVAWWRVVYADGRLVTGHEAEQAARLRAEGVDVHDGRVAAFKSSPPRFHRGGPVEAPPNR